MYDFFLGKMLFPVSPPKLSLKVKNRNKTIELIGGDEVNVTAPVGLREYSFTVMLPNVPHSFAKYPDGFQPALHYLEQLRDIKVKAEPVQFIISRFTPDGKPVFDTNIRVALEDYDVTEDAKGGGDVYVDIKLKESPHHGAKSGQISEDGSVILMETRNADSAPRVSSYTVQTGDSLWSIARLFLGNGERFAEIYLLNRELLDKANEVTGFSKYTIYTGQVLRMPT